MQYNNIPGSFGLNSDREQRLGRNDMRGRNNTGRALYESRIDFNSLSLERWVDIICILLLAVFVIAVILSWADFSTMLFERILFPVIYSGSRIAALFGLIGAGIGFLWLKLRRRRFF